MKAKRHKHIWYMNEFSRSVIPLPLSHLPKTERKISVMFQWFGIFLTSIFPGRKPIVPIPPLTAVLSRSGKQSEMWLRVYLGRGCPGHTNPKHSMCFLLSRFISGRWGKMKERAELSSVSPAAHTSTGLLCPGPCLGWIKTGQAFRTCHTSWCSKIPFQK